MTTYKHIVQVHPVENGEVNLFKVELEEEYDTDTQAMARVTEMNENYAPFGNKRKAVYRGRVNDTTGELR